MMDLVICGAIIVDHDMIEKVIASCPSYPFSKKYILFDGAPSDVGDLRRESYLAYTHYRECIFQRDDQLYYKFIRSKAYIRCSG